MLPEDRYRHDPWFHNLVDALVDQLRTAQFTPQELREAAVLAAIRYELRRPPSPVLIRGSILDEVKRRLTELLARSGGEVQVLPAGEVVESASDRRARGARGPVDPDARITRRPYDYLAALQIRDPADWDAQVNGVWPPAGDRAAEAEAERDRRRQDQLRRERRQDQLRRERRGADHDHVLGGRSHVLGDDHDPRSDQ